MTPEDVQTLVHKAREAWIEGDAEGFASLFLPDGEFVVPGNQWQGQEAIREVLAEFARTHSDIKVEIRRVLVEGNCAVVEWYWEDVETKTGHQTQAEDAIAIDFEQGLIRRWREYIDAKTPKARNGSA